MSAYRYQAPAPTPKREAVEDRDLRRDLRPNGEDIHRYNLGDGNRRVTPHTGAS